MAFFDLALGAPIFRLECWLRVLTVVLASYPAASISDVHAEPLGLEASTEVPIYFSFTTGLHAAYGLPHEDDGSVKMMLALQLTVFCRPELEACMYVELGENNNCRKVLEAPLLPPLAQCVLGPFGIMTLELRGALERNTRYDLVVLGTLPAAGKVITGAVVRVVEPAEFLDIAELVSYEFAEVPFVPDGLVVRSRTPRHVTGFELVSPVTSTQGVALQQYTFRLTGSSEPFARGDQIRIFSSPFLYTDEGLSFGGPCDGFDVSGFASPLRDCTCEVAAVPELDARVGYNVVVLTFGAAATLAEEPEYFRVALNTPKEVGSFGLWFVASRDANAVGGEDPLAFNRVLPARGPFFVAPAFNVVPSMDSPLPVYGASHTLHLAIFPRVILLGATSAPPTITVSSPALFQITSCRLAGKLSGPSAPEVILSNPGAEDAYCEVTFKDKCNVYAHQSVSIILEVVNPGFGISAELWHVALQSGDASMSSFQSFPGWPVYRALKEAFVVPLSMEYAKWNEVTLFFRPATTSPPEPRVVLAAPYGFLFDEECAFDIILGFPHAGVMCSNPLSESGRNLFSLRMPMMTAFEAGTFYAANVYPLRNPYPGSHSHVGELDDLPWRIDLVTMDGAEVIETTRGVPMGPNLRGFAVYPRSLLDPAVIPSVRTPNAVNDVTLRFSTVLQVTAHGERLLITAPYGNRWKIGAPVFLSLSSPTATSGDAEGLGMKVPIADLAYDASYPPTAPPHNQIELTLVNPSIPPSTDLVVRGTLLNAAVDPLLNEDVRSANVWVLEMYEPGAGYLAYEYRHQAVVFQGFPLQAITGGSVTAWLPFASRTQTQIMLTFRLGTTLHRSDGFGAYAIEVVGPKGFFFPRDCAARRISPIHLEVDGYTSLPEGSIASCHGGGEDEGEDVERIARIELTDGVEVERRVLYALTLEAVVPDTLPTDNTWAVRSFTGQTVVEEAFGIQGFRLSTEFLSVVYHPGTVDTGEDLRVGASDNRVMFSVQPAAPVEVGGELVIMAPYRFSFVRECRQMVYGARDILSVVVARGENAMLYHDLPAVASCLGVRNVARLTFEERLDVAIRYTFRIAVSNPLVPHPPDWPLSQDQWRFETLDRTGGPLNAAEVQAFFLWAFARLSVTPLAQGSGEHTVVTIELEASLTVPPYGFVLVAAPESFVVPAEPSCVDFQRDTYGGAEGFSPLPPGTTCGRGPGGSYVAKLGLDGMSYLAAAIRFRFRIGVINPVTPSLERDVGSEWSVSSAEIASLGEAFLERNPSVEGYPVHERLKVFDVHPGSRLAGASTFVTLQVAIHDSFGTFEVLTTTEASYLVVDMPMLFSVRVLPRVVDHGGGLSSSLHVCEEFLPLYPEPEFFPAPSDGCSAPQAAPTFRLRLVQNLLVGPDYVFRVGIRNPVLDALSQKRLSLVNAWQVRLVRVIKRRDITYTGRSAEGYRVVPLLQRIGLVSATPLLSVHAQALVSLSFEVVSPLAAASSGVLHVGLPPSIRSLPGTVGADAVPALCQFWVARRLQPARSFECTSEDAKLIVRLLGALAIPSETEVQVDFDIQTGNRSLEYGVKENLWTVASLTDNGTVLDMKDDIAGFTVFPALEGAALLPKDVAAMSYRNHAEFRFSAPSNVPGGSELHIAAPAGFTLYPLTFRASLLPGSDQPTQPVAEGGGDPSEVIISLPYGLTALEAYAFHLTIGNPPVSPPENEWVFRVAGDGGQTLFIDPRVPGFVVESQFNTSIVQGQFDEPLAENYVYITISLGERLIADNVLARDSCEPTVTRPVCPARQGGATFLVVEAPEGFIFQDTCGFWSLQRAGSRHSGLPPGSLCLVDSAASNSAHVRVAQSLEALRLYEFTLQVRNGMSTPLVNVWKIQAVQDGVIRERNTKIPGFALRQLRSVRVTPSTTVSGVVDNTVTIQMRSERPVTRGSFITIVAPVGFAFDVDQVDTSFMRPVAIDLISHEFGNAIRLEMDQADFVPPNTHLVVSVRMRNPPETPVSNYWFFYLQSQFLEHIDLRKFYPGFAIARLMHYCQAYPNTLPWDLGAANDVSIFFVTKTPIFTVENAPAAQVVLSDAREVGVAASGVYVGWQLVLVAPIGFAFPALGKYSSECSGFRRWGGKDSYDQLPESAGTKVTCTVQTSRSVLIAVPTTLVKETRYSFRINATVADRRVDIARQDPWRLTVLHGSEILHIGEGPTPLIGTYYEAEWFFALDEDPEYTSLVAR